MNEKMIFEFEDNFGEIIEVEFPNKHDAFSTNFNYYDPSCPTGGWYYDT